MISNAQRRRADARRRAVIQQSNVFARNLASLRRKETERVILLAQDTLDARNWAQFFDTNFSEAKYFPNWYKGLVMSTGKLGVTQAARDLAGKEVAKALEMGVFENSLLDYAETRGGELIVTVSGTMKDALKAEIYKALDEDINISVESMAHRLKQYAKNELLWQARRIAQTECLAGLAEGAHEAADSLNIAYLKTWCVSGLSNSRDSHLAMDGTQIEQNDWFVFDDCRMRYAHDMQNGTAAQVINCACSVIYEPKD